MMSAMMFSALAACRPAGAPTLSTAPDSNAHRRVGRRCWYQISKRQTYDNTHTIDNIRHDRVRVDREQCTAAIAHADSDALRESIDVQRRHISIQCCIIVPCVEQMSTCIHTYTYIRTIVVARRRHRTSTRGERARLLSPHDAYPRCRRCR